MMKKINGLFHILIFIHRKYKMLSIKKVTKILNDENISEEARRKY